MDAPPLMFGHPAIVEATIRHLSPLSPWYVSSVLPGVQDAIHPTQGASYLVHDGRIEGWRPKRDSKFRHRSVFVGTNAAVESVGQCRWIRAKLASDR